MVSLFLGSTGLARRFVALVPDALKAGILLGAGVAAVRLVFDKDGKQIASIAKKETLSQFKWDASKISGGLPITLLPFSVP